MKRSDKKRCISHPCFYGDAINKDKNSNMTHLNL